MTLGEFITQAKRIFSIHKDKARLVLQMKEDRLVFKVTDDVDCFKFSSDQFQDLKSFQKLNSELMRTMVVWRNDEAGIKRVFLSEKCGS